MKTKMNEKIRTVKVRFQYYSSQMKTVITTVIRAIMNLISILF